MVFESGFMLGLMLQLSVGPVFFSVLHTSIKKGAMEGIKMTCAVALVDALYIGLSFSSVSALLHINHVETLISLLGMLVLIYFGLSFIKNARKKTDKATTFEGNSFIYGLKITLINPITIVFWSGTFGSLLAAHKFTGLVSMAIYASGCVSATVLFLGGTSLFGKYLSRYVDMSKFTFIDYTIGIVLIIFGVKMFLAGIS